MYVVTGFKVTENLLTLIRLYFKHKWPQAIVSDDSGQRKPLQDIKSWDDLVMKTLLNGHHDFVLYESEKAAKRTDRFGWVPSVYEKSIIFFNVRGELDFEFGEEEHYGWIDELVNNLRANRIFLETVQHAAD